MRKRRRRSSRKKIDRSVIWFLVFIAILQLFFIAVIKSKKAPKVTVVSVPERVAPERGVKPTPMRPVMPARPSVPIRPTTVARPVIPVPAVAPAALKGRIAIVIDDWGYNLNNSSALDEIKYPLTAAVLPNLSYTQKVAEDLHNRGFEIILHLPMEPWEKVGWEKNTITSSMNEGDIRKIVDEDLANIVYAKGVSNHMGSRATESRRLLEATFSELKKKHLYFLDSYVSSRSVALDLAEKTGVPFARRDVFLDNKEEPKYIKEQLLRLKKKAKIYGSAVGIGHNRKNTLEVLKEEMPKLEKEGYRFVFVSELLK